MQTKRLEDLENLDLLEAESRILEPEMKSSHTVNDNSVCHSIEKIYVDRDGKSFLADISRMQMEALQTSSNAPLRFGFSSSAKHVHIAHSSLEADEEDGRLTENTGHHPTDAMEKVSRNRW